MKENKPTLSLKLPWGSPRSVLVVLSRYAVGVIIYETTVSQMTQMHGPQI
jgi:hypothetical protein